MNCKVTNLQLLNQNITLLITSDPIISNSSKCAYVCLYACGHTDVN